MHLRHQFSSGDEVIVSRGHPLDEKAAWKGTMAWSRRCIVLGRLTEGAFEELLEEKTTELQSRGAAKIRVVDL